MRYLFALLIPPLSVLSCGKIISFVCNTILYALAWLFLLMGMGSLVLPIVAIAAILLVPLAAVFWLVSALHAILVVGSYNGERRHAELLAAARR